MKEYIIGVPERTGVEDPAMVPAINQRELVRCKDCKWWHESEREEGFGDCGQANGITLKQSNWFCADGVAKDTDVTHRCDGCQYHAPEGYCRYFIGCPYKDN